MNLGTIKRNQADGRRQNRPERENMNTLREYKENEKLLARLAEIEKMLDEKAVREELSTVDMVTAHKITDTIKDILKGGNEKARMPTGGG